MRAWCWGLLLLNLFGALNSLALAAPEPLQLLGRSSVEGYRVQLGVFCDQPLTPRNLMLLAERH